jgi:HK97 family phage major capsid protein
MATKLVEAREELAAKRQQLADIFKAYPELNMPADVVSDIQRRTAELDELGKSYDTLKALDDAQQANAAALKDFTEPASRLPFPTGKGTPAPDAQPWSVDRMLSESKGYQDFRAGRVKTVEFNLDPIQTKTLLTLTDITGPNQRLPDITPSAQAFRPVSDLFLQGQTSATSIEYYEETTFTNNAAEVAEGGSKPESALSFTLRTDAVRKIATWIPATDEVLTDVPMLRSYIEGRLRFMLMRRRDAQLLNGDGTAPNISGITDRSGIQTQAKGGDPTFDAILKAMTKVRVTGDAEPTGIVLHPNDWEAIVLTRTADGLYILGNPGDQVAAQRLWGLDVRVTPVQTENTAIVGAFTPMAQIFQREGVTITVSTEHSTYFVENKVAILAEERLALAVYRPAAFCTVTGI